MTALSMFLASREYRRPMPRLDALRPLPVPRRRRALIFVLGADAYRNPPAVPARVRRRARAGAAVVRARAGGRSGDAAVFAPGHLMIAGALAAAGVGHLLLLRQVRMLGAAVAGVGLLTLRGVNAWTAIDRCRRRTRTARRRSASSARSLYLITAGGMQLMTFEDMTYELRRTNRRLREAQNKLRRAVITDPLTGCRNRRFFDEIIGRELQRHRRYGIPLSLLFVDIDRFKAINDTLRPRCRGRSPAAGGGVPAAQHPRGRLRVPVGRRRVPGADLVQRGGGAQAGRRARDRVHGLTRRARRCPPKSA